MAYLISQELPVFGSYPTKKCNVLYLNEENSNAGIYSIITRIKKGLGIETLKSKSLHFTTIQNLNIDEDRVIKLIIDYVKNNDIKLIFLDSFRRFFSANENDATEMNKIYSNLKRIRVETGAAIISIHHLKKDPAAGSSHDLRDQIRGSSDIVNCADCIIGVDRKHGQKGLVMFHVKSRAGEEQRGKKILVEGEGTNSTSFKLIGDISEEKADTSSKAEKCADKIIKFLEDKKLAVFVRQDIKEVSDNFAFDTVTKALRILKTEGNITESAFGRSTKYTFNLAVKQEEKKEETYIFDEKTGQREL
jgi:hypothetical protein